MSKNCSYFLKKKFIGVLRVVATKFRLLLEFYWVSSGDKSIEFVIVRRVVAKLSLFASSGDLIMAGRGSFTWWW